RTAAVLASLPDLPSIDYCSGLFPPEGDPTAPDYFFAVTLHQYGFWYDDGNKYTRPMYAVLEGEERKGSDFLFGAFARAARREPDFLLPRVQSRITDGRLAELLADDSGICPLPLLSTHGRLARGYGADIVARGLRPGALLAAANSSPDPLKTFLDLAGSLTGYREDPFRKKILLLALILSNRPERFLSAADSRHWSPIVDYHNLRCALRLGLVEVRDRDLSAKLAARTFVSGEEEFLLRKLVWEAVREMIAVSGRSVGQVDALLFRARRSCPEMTEPDCPSCIFGGVCRRRTELFQPVYRTTFY
nr:hypothetical protein [bacterium]